MAENDDNKSPLSSEELQRIANFEENNTVVRFLKHQDSMRFNVGDILIRQYKRYYGSEQGTWTTQTVSDKSSAPKKFMYVFENEHGVGYLKQLQANGKGFAKATICMADVNPTMERYIVDPDYQDHLLIGEGNFKYDSSFKEDKRRRNNINKKNKSLLTNTSTWAKVNEAMKTLKKGDRFWLGHDMQSATLGEYEVTVAAAFEDISKAPHSWWASQADGTSNLFSKLEVRRLTHSWPQYMYTPEILNMKLFLVKPFSYEDEP